MSMSKIKVLEVSTGAAAYCGRLLAELGYQVVRVTSSKLSSRLDANQSAQQAPISPFWFNYNDVRKRVVDLDQFGDKAFEIVERLQSDVDVIIGDVSLSVLEAIGCDVNRDRASNRRLIYASISAYGSDGPYKDFQASPATIHAMSGVLHGMNGAQSEPLVELPESLCFYQAGTQACAAVLLALLNRDQSGIGDFIDLSMYESMAYVDWLAFAYFSAHNSVLDRFDPRIRASPAFSARRLWACKNGTVRFQLGQVIDSGKVWLKLSRWLAECHVVSTDKISQWMVASNRTRDIDEIENAVADIFNERPASWIMEEGQKRGLAVTEIRSDLLDVLRDPQLVEEHFFNDAAVGDLNVKIPGPPFRLMLGESDGGIDT